MEHGTTSWHATARVLTPSVGRKASGKTCALTQLPFDPLRTTQNRDSPPFFFPISDVPFISPLSPQALLTFTLLTDGLFFSLFLFLSTRDCDTRVINDVSQTRRGS